jgi:hypothetical protein
MDPMRFIESNDVIEILTMQAIAAAVAELRAKTNGGK